VVSIGDDWVLATDGSRIPVETVVSRMRDLGWSRKQAESRPVDFGLNALGGDSAAKRAGYDSLSPVKVQAVMQFYGVVYEEARDYLKV
jgi:uncharacterized protein (DUF433 family)